MPRDSGSATQFGADGQVMVAAQQEDGVGSGIGVEGAGGDERAHQAGGQAPLSDQVITHARQLARGWQWES
jgi:hypothetical protein